MSKELAASLRIVKFETRYPLKNPENPNEGYKEVDYVITTSVGNAKYIEVPQRIADIKRRTDGTWEIIKPYYEAWKDGQELPADGTPLAAWHGVRPEMVEVLRAHRIRTVEELAVLPDSSIDQIKLPGLRNVRDAAKAWEQTADKRAVAADLAAKDAEIDALKQQMADLMAMLKGDPTEEPIKRKPGRPRKEDPEADAA